MSEYKLKELEYVDGGFRARFTPVANDLEVFITNEEGIEMLLNSISKSRESITIETDEDLKETNDHSPFNIVFVPDECMKKWKWIPCCWLRRLSDE